MANDTRMSAIQMIMAARTRGWDIPSVRQMNIYLSCALPLPKL